MHHPTGPSPGIDDAMRPLLAALSNPTAREAFARVVLSATPDAPNRREERALSQLQSAGLITRAGTGWAVDESHLRGLLQQGARTRPKNGPERFLTTDGRIDRYPSDHGERDEFLRSLLPRVIASTETLSEAELGARLSALTDDTARLRRAFVDHGILHRDPSGAAYRLPSTPDVEWFDQPIGEDVEIHTASDEWADLGRLWVKRLTDAFAPLPTCIDHVGSTAVPGLAAKPVIDIQVQVPDLTDETSYLPALEELGLVLRARGADFRFLRPPAGRTRDVHVHVCEIDSTWAAEHLAFRDALREHDSLAEEYEALKRHLAATVTERADYNRGKESFIRDVIARHAQRTASHAGIDRAERR
ncbi:GrpB family protein [Microbacterium sp.]|uniref:GrpB family protein n=1 Tax=Microbacterium sp. TaxID=51671 RepID=UPI002622E7C0|nr:GrpB family protein [Microbacterium sp.]